jgi:hypothetical protein
MVASKVPRQEPYLETGKEALRSMCLQNTVFSNYTLMPAFTQLFKTFMEATMHNLKQCNFKATRTFAESLKCQHFTTKSKNEEYGKWGYTTIPCSVN